MDKRIRELSCEELQIVGCGASRDAAALAFGFGSGWATTVAGGAVGYVVGNGIRGALAGGAVGFGIGALIGVGMYLAQSGR